jgi:hypothetical protein
MAAPSLSGGQIKTARTQARQYLIENNPELDISRWDTIEKASQDFLGWLDNHENKSIADVLRQGEGTEVIKILQTQARYLKRSKKFIIELAVEHLLECC